MKLTNSISDGNAQSSGKPTTSKASGTKPSAAANVNAELDKKKSGNGKIGSFKTTIKLTRTGTGEYRFKPLLASRRLNRQTLGKIVQELKPKGDLR